jgi:uncharacterized membrane protein YfcA
LLVKQSRPGWYEPDISKLLGLPPALFRYDIITIVQIGWAWVALSIVGSYVGHTWRLDRTTVAGKSADVLMWLQYILLLMLALFMWIGIPEAAELNEEPFFG